MSELKFACSHCHQPLACDDQFSGRQITCPACKTLIAVPGKPAPNPPAIPKTGMTFVPESWPKPEAGVTPPQKTGLTHVPDSWGAAAPKENPEKSR
jgi:DNA-directed RNA polymerase subunit RPC12/RpoP